MTDIHSCSYYCDRPGCIKAQRDELRDSNGAGNQVPPCTQPAPAQEPRSTTCTMTDAPCTRNCGLACAMQMEALRQEPAQRLSESDVWINSAIMVANADAGLQMPVLMKLVRAIEAAICPPGYVVVPMEPTPEMVSAGWNYLPSAKGDWFIKNVWGAMIAAAQKATP